MIAKRYTILKKLIDSEKIIVDMEKGEVYSTSYGRKKKIGAVSKSNGYVQIGVFYNGETRKFGVHQCVMVAAGYDLTDKEVNHINKIRTDNRIDNLEVVTHKENMQHSLKGVTAMHLRKLTDEQINEIKELRNAGMPIWELAWKYDVSDTVIRKWIKK